MSYDPHLGFGCSEYQVNSGAPFVLELDNVFACASGYSPRVPLNAMEWTIDSTLGGAISVGAYTAPGATISHWAITGALSPPGNQSITLSVSDGTDTASETFTFIVVGVPYNLGAGVFTVIGGVASRCQVTSGVLSGAGTAITWAASNLPAGFTIDSSSGLISGTYAEADFTGTIVVTATNTFGTASIDIPFQSVYPTPAITSPSVWNANVGVASNYQITANDSPTSFSATGLVTGFSINESTGLITGTPTAPGNLTLGVTARYPFALTATAEVTLNITAPIPIVTIPAGLWDGTEFVKRIQTGTAVNIQCTATHSPTSWAATNLPAGVTISDTGLISGTSDTAGISTLSITATNVGGASVAAVLNLVYQTGGITTTIMSFVNNVALGAGALISQNDAAITNAVWSVSNLPPGLAVGTSTAGNVLLTGTPTLAGVYPVSVSVAQNGTPLESHTGIVTITVTPGVPIISIPSTLWNGANYVQAVAPSTAFTLQLSATDNPTSWTAAGLPAGLAISDTGLISGTPTATGTSDAFFTATNATGTSAPAEIIFNSFVPSNPPQNYLPWVNNNPFLTDLQMNSRSGVITSFCADSGGLYLKAGDDLNLAIVISDPITGAQVTALNDLQLVICPVNDFESFYVDIDSVEAVDTGSGVYFAIHACLDAEGAPRLQRDFDNLDKSTGPAATANTISAMLEIRIETTDAITRRSRLFPVTIEQNASI